MHRCALALMAVVIATLLCGCSVKITGLYSNMHYIENGSNVQGTEMLVVRGDRGSYFGVLQCANGSPGKPVVVSAVITAQDIVLSPTNEPSSHCSARPFKGTISASGITGSFAGGPKIFLKRGDSYWQ